MTEDNHPRSVLLGAQARTGILPVCDHYSGIPSRMVQSLELQEITLSIRVKMWINC